jgi:hypothetical protein
MFDTGSNEADRVRRVQCDWRDARYRRVVIWARPGMLCHPVTGMLCHPVTGMLCHPVTGMLCHPVTGMRVLLARAGRRHLREGRPGQ